MQRKTTITNASMPLSENFIQNNAEMLDAAERCIELKQHLPALVLIFSHIDALAWAGSSKQTQGARARFEEWVSKWLLPELIANAPTLTATDLYAARCGVLHSLTSKSHLSETGAAKEIAYAWGNAEASILDALIEETKFAGKLITLHYNDLLRGLSEGAGKFIQQASSDPSLQAHLEEAAGRHYTRISSKK